MHTEGSSLLGKRRGASGLPGGTERNGDSTRPDGLRRHKRHGVKSYVYNEREKCRSGSIDKWSGGSREKRV